VCGGCGEEKDYGAFSKNKTTNDGYQNYCKACTKNHREKLLSAGMCRGHPDQKLLEGRKECRLCIDRREKFLSDGMCPKHPDQKLLDGMRNCLICRNNAFQRKFGISADKYDEMYKAQDGKCAICGKQFLPSGRGAKQSEVLCVDHCHKTGQVRQLLCTRDNKILGSFKEDMKEIRRFTRGTAKYIDKWAPEDKDLPKDEDDA
jgi:hypothetical protein